MKMQTVYCEGLFHHVMFNKKVFYNLKKLKVNARQIQYFQQKNEKEIKFDSDEKKDEWVKEYQNKFNAFIDSLKLDFFISIISQFNEYSVMKDIDLVSEDSRR